MFEGLEKKVRKNSNGGEVISYWKDGVMVYKSCSKCGEIKEIGCFGFRKSRNVYRPECKECKSKEERESYHKNKDKYKKKNQKYYQEHKEYFKDFSKRQYEENKEYLREYQKQWRKSHPEYMKKYAIRLKESKQGYVKKQFKLKPIKKVKLKTPLEIAIQEERNKEKERLKYQQKKEENRRKAIKIMQEYDPLIKELKLNEYGYIYKFENIKTGRCYIGQTILPLTVRYQENIIGNWIKERLNKASQKFKEELIEEDFKITEVLAVGCCRWHLDKLEVYYIDKFNSQHNGYNNQPGNYHSDDGIEEFNQILKENNLQFKDGELRII